MCPVFEVHVMQSDDQEVTPTVCRLNLGLDLNGV